CPSDASWVRPIAHPFVVAPVLMDVTPRRLLVQHATSERHYGIGGALSGRFARFGVRAANALNVWSELDGAANVVTEDDRSDPEVVEDAMKRVAAHCDVLLGPYSKQLVWRAARIAMASDWLLWNHGGSGEDVEASAP